MFIITPLILIFCSLLGIAIIVWRKKSYLDKISALNIPGHGSDQTAVLNGGSFSWKACGAEFFPEIKGLLEKFKFYEYRAKWLMEAEKSLRRTRLVFLKVDRLSDGLIKKIRRVHVNSQMNVQSRADAMDSKNQQQSPAVSKTISPAFLKNEEQRLIIEIAKNPKNPELYETLGDLYVEMGSYVDAKESYEAAIELSPNGVEVKNKLSSVLEKLV